MKPPRGWRSPAIRAIFEAAEEAGWRWREGNHVILYPPDGSSPLILSRTAYDGHENKKIEALARRRGLELKEKR